MNEYIQKWLGIKKTTYHSFDCATKTLGVYCAMIIDSDSIVNILLNNLIYENIKLHQFIKEECQHPNYHNNILEKILFMRKTYDVVKYLITHQHVPLYYDIWDISHNMVDRKDIERAALNLKTNLNYLIDKISYPDKMLYEYQMVDNDKSRTISHYLIYHYSGCSKIVKRGAIYKNKIFYKTLRYQNYLQHITDPYKARKAHCADNFKYWCIVNKMNYLQFGPKLDDVGDAFMQLMAYINNVGPPV
jgi:hypothetical protein